MACEAKRILRERKTPKYLNSDEEDPDKVSFSQLKSHHDYSGSQSQKLNDAKILVKFIQKANKSLRTYISELHPNATQQQRHESSKKGQSARQTTKKPAVRSKQDFKEPVQKNKPAYSAKPQIQQKEREIQKPPQIILNGLKNLSSIAAIGRGVWTDQLKKIQNLYPEINNITYQSLAQNINPNLSSAPSIQKKKSDKPKSSIFAEEKLFKRSAYHVAIAYHIYLKNFKEKGETNINEIDPTYHAKKLKEQSKSDQ